MVKKNKEASYLLIILLKFLKFRIIIILICHSTNFAQAEINKPIDHQDSKVFSLPNTTAPHRDNLYLTKDLPDSLKFNAKAILSNLSAEHFSLIVPSLNRLTAGIKPEYKLTIISALCNIPLDNMTPEYLKLIEEAANFLTSGIDQYNKVVILTTLPNIPKKCLVINHLKAIQAATNQITLGMNTDEKTRVICALLKIFPEHLQETEAAIFRITNKMNILQKINVITALSEISPENTSIVETAINHLTPGLSIDFKAGITCELSKVPIEDIPLLIDPITDLIKNSTDPTNDLNKDIILNFKGGLIFSLIRISPKHIILIQEAFHSLKKGVDTYHKPRLILALSDTPYESLSVILKAVNNLKIN
jgi:hypothetical protein